MAKIFPSLGYANSPIGITLRNSSATSQTPAATVRTQIAGTKIQVPATLLRVGSKYKARFNMTKTAAGTAASTVDVSIGTAGTTADAAALSFTKPAGTAAADEGFVEVVAVVRTIGATGVLVGEFTMSHTGLSGGAGVGHTVLISVNLNVVSGSVDLTVDDLFLAVNLTSGASDAITINVVETELTNV